ncbi:MAG: tetratricopeptide repeat protein, partial [Planctomycetota bacterium]|nr:tetratricopeptide repeat protein [Planctomycetota bacterium]
HHQAGRLRQAAEIYQSILAREPLNVDALHLAGVLALQAGNPRRATELIGRAIALRPNESSFYNNQGEAFRLLGQLDQAGNCYRTALRLRARYPEAANNLGLVFKLRGQLDDAIVWLQKAIQWQPDYALACNNLGVAFQERGDAGQALAAFRRAVELAPAFAEALSNLGQALLEAHAAGDALPYSRKAVELRANFAPGHNNLGNVLRDLGQLAEAKASYLEALRLDPSLSLACNNMGQALQEEGAFPEALSWYQRGLQLEPSSARIHTNLASVLEEQEKFDEAITHCELALRSDPNWAEAHGGLGSIFRELNRLEEAMARYREAIRLKPGLAAAHCGMGEILEELGRFAEAEACFREALRHDPRNTGAYSQLAVQCAGSLPDADMQAIESLLASPHLSQAKRTVLRYGLAKVLDARGIHDQAAVCLREANVQRKAHWEKRGEGYDPVAHTRYVDELIATFTPEFLQRTQGFGLDSERPVFIVGLPRSSTTLTEQILASHSKVFGAGELRFIHDALDALPKAMGLQAPPLECLRQCTKEAVQALAQRHLDRLQSLNAQALRVTDKMPDNYLNVGAIATLFPKAKIIHCRRDLRDVAVSCWITNFRHIRWACDTDQIAARFREYVRLMDHWRKVLPGRMLDVDYEETVSDLESVARRLVSWVGLEWEPACLAFHKSRRPVRTASVTQVRQPIHKRSLQRWKNYETPLARLFEQLQALQT